MGDILVVNLTYVSTPVHRCIRVGSYERGDGREFSERA